MITQGKANKLCRLSQSRIRNSKTWLLGQQHSTRQSSLSLSSRSMASSSSSLPKHRTRRITHRIHTSQQCLTFVHQRNLLISCWLLHLAWAVVAMQAVIQNESRADDVAKSEPHTKYHICHWFHIPRNFGKSWQVCGREQAWKLLLDTKLLRNRTLAYLEVQQAAWLCDSCQG